MLRLPSVRSAAAALAIGVIAVSVLAAVVRPLQLVLGLAPEAVTDRFFLWQVVSYAFLEVSPVGVIFGALITWSLGGALEAMWGRRRFLTFTFGVVALAALATVGLSLLAPALVAPLYPGGMVMTGALWVAYGLHLGRAQANFWGFPTTGNVLALIGAGFVFLNAAFGGLSMVIPEAFALLFTFLASRGVRPGLWWTRFRGWQLERDLKKRSRHLRSIDGGRRSGGAGSDKYLH